MVLKNSTNQNGQNFRDVRNDIKKTINKKITQFNIKILCPKNSKGIWKAIHFFLSPNGNMLKAGQSPRNKFFNETPERLMRNNPANNDVIMSYIDS